VRVTSGSWDSVLLGSLVDHETVKCEGHWWVMGQCSVRVTGGSWVSVM
jgi:hypothetical protein